MSALSLRLKRIANAVYQWWDIRETRANVVLVSREDAKFFLEMRIVGGPPWRRHLMVALDLKDLALLADHASDVVVRELSRQIKADAS